ncbi:integrase [Skermanella aerolata]|uniref:Integrase n=1 Tax=Skermanella aerolata TaxID=393310 RepID=A0A512E068_9PROT|nr:site-specific integrase [Skermanella aerolata]KJB91322.1 integrase [Skermanella aerolata KACC 11604]GEO42133.1 integrase [Skermanella aerolata]
MPRLTQKSLSAAFVAKVSPTSVRVEYPDASVRGLRLRVEPTGRKTWFALGRAEGKLVRDRLGEYPTMSLADARFEAVKALGEMRKGTRTKATVPSTRSVEFVAEEWLRRDQSGNRSAADVERSIRKDVLPVIGMKEIAAVSKADIHSLLDGIVDRGAPVEANRVFSRLRRMFTWAMSRDYIAVNPLASMEAPSVEQSRNRVLSHDELRQVWTAAGQDSYPFGPMTQLLILTGQRLREVSNACWREIDLEHAVWTIPAERAKNGIEHVVHLSPPAMQIISGLPKLHADFLFTTTLTTTVSGFARAQKRISARSRVTGWCYHDLRRSFATIASQDLAINPVVVDKILNHASTSVRGVAAVYQRGKYLDQRKAAMDAWGSFICSLAEGSDRAGSDGIEARAT